MRLSFDRYEGDFLVFVNEDGETYDYHKNNLKEPLEIGDVIEAEITDGKIISFEKVPGERERYAKENADLMELLKRRKNKH